MGNIKTTIHYFFLESGLFNRRLQFLNARMITPTYLFYFSLFFTRKGKEEKNTFATADILSEKAYFH